MKRTKRYPMGSVSSGTMQPDDLIPTFVSELESLARQPGIVSAKQRKEHVKLARDIRERMEDESYYDSKMTFAGLSGKESFADGDLEVLFSALEEYAAPYFYFGAHPGDGADYGYWLSESWDEDFYTANHRSIIGPASMLFSLKVDDTSEIPKWFRGEVAVVNDRGNVTLYIKTARTLREVWSVV